MAFSDELLDAGAEIWEAQYEHPFVTELADGTLDPDAFRHWVEQDYRYLLDYARTFAIAATKARQEERMAGLLNVAHTTLHTEMDFHREFAADYGIPREDLDSTVKAPTCVAYTNFLVRTAHEGTLPEIAAAVYPCGQGYLDVAEHMAELADEEHRYTPFIEMYTSDEFYEVADWLRTLVDDCAERNPGEREAMREAFLTSARLEHEFWEMCYQKEKLF
ncbi:putative transcription activator [Halovivax ruber XH-70]|uniref:Putative transcription activator n=1 Tax=Halovivax ruber (strain DSM 18193 / JCM 13892 / XH-70) TaxID=797302 RepID=L0I7D3_HALRX|nr:thiaminase II [Halovivax ruber]AGB14693.1 putative transcription activator [Halovivax ruber XH-70]